jgi:hypothetical protein
MLEIAGAGALLGVVILLMAPSLAAQTRFNEWAGNAYATIAMQTLRRPAIAVSENTEFSLRRRLYDADYRAEKVDDGSDTTAYIAKISDTVQRWGQRPFTFVDEKFGITFDLRDVAVGRQVVEYDRDGEMVVSDRPNSYTTLVRAFIELRERKALKMDLGESVHPITDGSEDAHAWDRVYEAVKRMFLPYQDPVGVLKLALPMLAVVGGFLAGFYFFGPGRLPGESGTSQPIGVGATLLLLAAGGGRGDGDDESDQPPSRTERLIQRVRAVESRTWKQLGLSVAIAAAVVTPLVIFQLAFVVFVAAAVGVVVLLPLMSSTLLSVLPATLAESIAETWMTLGLKAFDDPIIRQTETSEFGINEATTLQPEFRDTGQRYRFCKSYVGFTCDVTPDTFGPAGVHGTKIGEYRPTDVITDGGDLAPDGYEPTSKISNGGHNGFVPTFEAVDSYRRQATFVRSDRWLARFRDAATGKMAERAQQEATKEFAGGEPPFSDRQIMLFSLAGLAGGMIFSFILWGL